MVGWGVGAVHQKIALGFTYVYKALDVQWAQQHPMALVTPMRVLSRRPCKSTVLGAPVLATHHLQVPQNKAWTMEHRHVQVYHLPLPHVCQGNPACSVVTNLMCRPVTTLGGHCITAPVAWIPISRIDRQPRKLNHVFIELDLVCVLA